MADGIIYLTADFTAAAGTQTEATVERGLSATGPWTMLGSVELLNQVGSFTDTTVPLDVNVWYQWTGSPAGAGSVIVQGPYIEVSTGTVLIKDPLRPWANIEAEFCSSSHQALSALCDPVGPEIVWVGLGTKTYRADANLFDVYNSRVPADIYGVRKRLDSEMRIFTKTCEAKDAVETLFAAGGPLQLQLPAEYCFPDEIVQPGDLTEDYISRDQRRPLRLWTAPFTIVDRPLGPVQGTECANWCVIEEVYPTFADLTATGMTWAQVASGEAGCPGGIPGEDGFGIGPFGDGPFGDGG